MIRQLVLALLLLCSALPAFAQELPNKGQSEAGFRVWLDVKPRNRQDVAVFERWLEAKGVGDVLPTWQLLRTASMWHVCHGPPFEVPPRKLWRNVARTLRFVRDQVVPAIGPVEAVSSYRNQPLNACARGARGSAHRDFSAVDLLPLQVQTRRVLIERLCAVHRGKGPLQGVGLGFYAFTRFHVDTRSFRRWGSAGPRGNESPCALVDRKQDPEAPPKPRAPRPGRPVITPWVPVDAPPQPPVP